MKRTGEGMDDGQRKNGRSWVRGSARVEGRCSWVLKGIRWKRRARVGLECLSRFWWRYSYWSTTTFFKRWFANLVGSKVNVVGHEQ